MIKVKKISNKALSVLVVFVLVIFPLFSGTVIAKPLTAPRGSVKTMQPEVASGFTSKVINSSRFQELKNKYDFDYTHNLAQVFAINDKEVTSVSIPIKDNTGENYSKYIVMYDSDGNYMDSILFVFHKVGDTYNFIVQNDNRKVEANIAEDGALLSGTLTDEKGQQHDLVSFLKDKEESKASNPLVSLLSPTPGYAGWFDCFGDCLADQGVPQYIITGVSLACAAICVVSVGTLCIQCIMVALAGWGAIGMTCAEHCWGWF
jgi:hypothetical protein